MFNIEYATFKAKLFKPEVFDLFKHLISSPDKLLKEISVLIKDYVYNVKESPKPKKETEVNIEYVKKLVDTLTKHNIYNIIEGSDYFLLKTKLIPLLEIFDNIITPEYNRVIYDYLFDEEKFEEKYKDKHFLLYVAPTNSNSVVKIINYEDLLRILKSKKSIFTITGCFFTKHDDYLGHIINIINNLMVERKKIKDKMKEVGPNDPQYSTFDMWQTAMKVLLNSFYGVYGFKTFRYNEKNIANTITLTGRLILKLAQYVSDKVVDEFTKGVL
jgi:hypothetical protein